METKSGKFEESCLCFSFGDICLIRKKRLLPEHLKELYLAKTYWEKFEKLKWQGNRIEAMKFFRKYEEIYHADWKKLYDFKIGIEII